MTEKERMTDKNQPPSAAKVQAFLGKDAWARLLRFEAMLQENYEVTRELKFPFGDSYGWVHYSVKTDAELTDILKLTGAKVAPKKSV